MNRINGIETETPRQRIEREYVERMKEIDKKYDDQRAQNDRSYKRQQWAILIVFVVFCVATFIAQVLK